MTVDEKQEEIDKILAEIAPLNHKRTELSLFLDIARRKYNESYDSAYREEIDGYLKKIKGLDQDINPLYSKLRSYQTRYYIEYEHEVYNTYSKKSIERKSETLFLTNDCNFDSYKNGWDLSTEDSKNLLNELGGIMNLRVSNYTIWGIKKIDE